MRPLFPLQLDTPLQALSSTQGDFLWSAGPSPSKRWCARVAVTWFVLVQEPAETKGNSCTGSEESSTDEGI
eukprot:m.3249 g.3249  ORF g.3249 m.3249 type:complete len:71 (+) comp2172_c0_seq2:80-292(+)